MLENILTKAALFGGVVLMTVGAVLRYGPVGLMLGGTLLIAGALLYAQGDR